ncbi:uncharacterized protein LOC108666270 isoform X2 [Hyalella azteca]|uniref:Uncharacterized protein LOC108666270 isoform X2 n=1 Tax=Hyalella azteca TaxID=294128 RepID=A0A979FUT7_HYAAZ|nr:uncharacterized protein LOC108666270 isoform X2 [Hyalella azteca]
MFFSVLKKEINGPSSPTKPAKVLCCDCCSAFTVVYDETHTLSLLHPISLSLLKQISIQFTGGSQLSHVSISPDEQLILCAASSGIVTIIKAKSGEVLCQVQDHRGERITSIVWQCTVGEEQKGSSCVFLGDDTGLVTSVNIPKTKVAALFKNLSTRLLKLSSRITQLDFLDDKLLVSTLSGSYICDTKRECFTRIGDKNKAGKFGGCLLLVWPCIKTSDLANQNLKSVPTGTAPNEDIKLRHVMGGEHSTDNLAALQCFDNEYIQNVESFYCGQVTRKLSGLSNSSSRTNGSCLPVRDEDGSTVTLAACPNSDTNLLKACQEEVRCFTGRPKARVWESDSSGCVLQTHQLLDVLAVPSLPIYDTEVDGQITSDSNDSSFLFEQIRASNLLPCDGGDRTNHHAVETSWDSETFSSSNSGRSSPFLSSIAFSQISRFQSKYLLLVCSLGIYCFDPSCCSIIFFLNVHPDGEVKIRRNNILFLCNGTFTKLTIMSPEVAIMTLHSMQHLQSCMHLSLQHLNLFECSAVLCRVRNIIIRDLLAGSLEINDDDRCKLEQIIQCSSISDDFKTCARFIQVPVNSINSHAESENLVQNQSLLEKSRFNCLNNQDDRPISNSPIYRPSDVNSILPLLRPRPVLGVRGGYIASPSTNLLSGNSVLQDLVESVAFNVSSSDLLSAFSSRVTAVAKRSYDSVANNLTDFPSFHVNSDTEPLATNNLSHTSPSIDEFWPNDDATGENLLSTPMPTSCSQSASDASNGTPNSCEEKHASFSDDDLIVVRSVSHGKRKHKAVYSKEKSCHTNTLPLKEKLLDREPTVQPNVAALKDDSLKKVSSELLKITMDSLRETKELSKQYLMIKSLSNWLCEFLGTLKILGFLNSNETDLCNLALREKCVQDSFSPNKTNNFGILKVNVSNMLVLCLKYKIRLDFTLQKNKLNPEKSTVIECHSLSSDLAGQTDQFYALLFTAGAIFIDYEVVINNFPLPNFYTFLNTWRVILHHIACDSPSDLTSQSPIIEILPNLDFNRCQRLSVMRRALDRGGAQELVKTAVGFCHRSTIFEVLLLLVSYLPHEKFLSDNRTLPSKQKSPMPLDMLCLYLTKMNQLGVAQFFYVELWSSCRELQYDIIQCILENTQHEFRSCDCGALLPMVLPKQSMLELLYGILTGPLYDPVVVYELCYAAGYWQGCFLVTAMHDVSCLEDYVNYALQSCSHRIIKLLLQNLQPPQVSVLISALANLCDEVSPHQLRCYQCRLVKDIKSVNAGDAQDNASDVYDDGDVLQLPEIWLLCTAAAVGLCGGSLTLQMLQAAVANVCILPGVIPPRDFIFCLAGVVYRWPACWCEECTARWSWLTTPTPSPQRCGAHGSLPSAAPPRTPCHCRKNVVSSDAPEMNG